MGMLEFDNQYAMFGTTPVENQFILEYLPAAKGDYVKVYLYGLALCYHPQPDMSLTQMSNELGLPEEEIMAAYRHWERVGLVHRVSDKPVRYQYVSACRQLVTGQAPSVDLEYVAFSESMHAVFNNERTLYAKEIQLAYEWVADLHLTTEVVMMLMRYMIAKRGRNFGIRTAQPLAVQLAEQGVKTIEDAEIVLGRDKQVWDGSRAIVRRFGKHRDPSKDEQDMYQRWVTEWGFSHDAIEAACAETTKGEPTFAYLEGILKGMMTRQGKAFSSREQVEQVRQAEKDETTPLKTVLSAMNIRVSVNEGTLKLYRDLKAIYPDDDIILLAARECSVMPNATLSEVEKMLRSWQNKGLRNASEIAAYIDAFRRQNRQVQELLSLWGVEGRPNAANRERVRKWLEDYHFSWDMVVGCAPLAKDAKAPMVYLDKLLGEFFKQGVTTLDQAIAANRSWQAGKQPEAQRRGGKVVHEQQYEQREYQNSDDELLRQMAEWKEMTDDA